MEAHIQHLYAYASRDSLPSGKVLADPRFNLVSRGCSYLAGAECSLGSARTYLWSEYYSRLLAKGSLGPVDALEPQIYADVLQSTSSGASGLTTLHKRCFNVPDGDASGIMEVCHKNSLKPQMDADNSKVQW